jgi:hypothetical protein
VQVMERCAFEGIAQEGLQSRVVRRKDCAACDPLCPET